MRLKEGEIEVLIQLAVQTVIDRSTFLFKQSLKTWRRQNYNNAKLHEADEKRNVSG